MIKIKDLIYKNISLLKILKEMSFNTKGLFFPAIIVLITLFISKGFIGFNAILITYILDEKVSNFAGSDYVNLLIGTIGIGYLFVLYKCVESICMPIVMWNSQTADTIIEADKIDKAIEILMRLPSKCWQDVDEAELSLRLDVRAGIKGIFYNIFRILIPALIEIFIALVALFFIDSIFELSVIAIVCVSYISIMLFVVPVLTKKFISHMKTEGKMSKFILEMFELARLVKSYGSQKIFIDKYKDELKKENKAFEDRIVALSFAEIIPSLMLAVSLSAIFVSLCLKLESGAITVGVFSATMAVATAILSNLKALVFVFASLMDFSSYVSFPFAVIESYKDIDFKDTSKVKKVSAGLLKVNNLSVSIGDKDILKDINFEIKEGEKVWLIGESGAGKSVLLSALNGFKTRKGSVCVGDNLVEDESAFASVPQNLGILEGSIKFNLLVGNQLASEDRMWEVLKSVGLEKCVKDKGGLLVEVKQDTFSGGELQKLAIARAIISDRPIILMDEPTSALDVYSEKQLVNTILSLNSSCLVSIHRLHAIPLGSRVLLLKDGKIEKDCKIEDVLN